MAAFVLEITEPDCHLLEKKYFLNYTPFSLEMEAIVSYCQKRISLAIILQTA